MEKTTLATSRRRATFPIMKAVAALLFSALLIPALPAADPGPIQSGKATIELLSAAASTPAGQPLLLGLSMKMEPSWHTYWINPGQTGIPLKLVWTLPEGFAAPVLLYPFPKKFESSGQTGFGYEDTVVFPCLLLWPAALTDVPTEIPLAVTASWLTCDPQACVPGKAKLALTVPVGDPQPSTSHELLTSAYNQVPATREGWGLALSQDEKTATLTVSAPAEADLTKATIFSATEAALEPRAPLDFQKNEAGQWTATVPLGEFAEKPLTQLQLVLKLPEENPIVLQWTIPAAAPQPAPTEPVLPATAPAPEAKQ